MTPRVKMGVFIAGGLVLAVLLAFLVAPEASSKPDGLEKVAEDEGFLDGARDHKFSGSPTADYGVSGIDDVRLSTGLAGVVGITVTFVFAGGLLFLVRRTRSDDDAPGSPSGPDSPVTSA